MVKDGDGNEIKIGQYVCFKDDVEQSGKVTEIRGQWIYIDGTDGRTGQTTKHVVPSDRCWSE